MTNATSGPRDRRVVNESAVERPASRPTLSYYVPPERPARPGAPARRERSRPRRSNEGAVPELAGGDSAFDDEILPDVAVASMGHSSSPRHPRLLEAVIGTDDRTKVDPTLMKTNPWRQICALRIESQSGTRYVGTGWFIGPRTLATAGHCVYLQDDGGWAKSITVIAAKSGSDEPYGELDAVHFASVDGWVKKRSRDFDYGVIALDDGAVGTRTGNFAVDALAPATLRSADAQISGYPADRDAAAFQYFHMRPLADVTDTRLVYDIDTFGGQSGSPIWQETASGIVAVGIHTNGGVTSNSGTRITANVLGNLARWTTEGVQ
jgi:glutamyl endopeptidase